MANISRDLLIDIFLRLPLASVVTCKCVCKAWRAVVVDPYFATIHAGIQLAHPSDPPLTSYILLQTGPYFMQDVRNINRIYVEDLDHNNTTIGNKFFDEKRVWHVNHPPLLDDHVIEKSNSTRIIGTCNGLVCITVSGASYISPAVVYNPVTSEYINLPDDGTESFFELQHGFGYHPLTKEYKIFRIVCCRSNLDKLHCVHILVYTLGSGAWRIKETKVLNNCFALVSVLVDGSLYWLPKTEEQRGVISYFDMVDEEIRTMQGPRVIPRFGVSRSQLMVLGGNLCITDIETSATNGIYVMDIWVMTKDENNVCSWSTGYKIRGFELPNGSVPDCSLIYCKPRSEGSNYPNGKNIMCVFHEAIICVFHEANGTRSVLCFDTEKPHNRIAYRLGSYTNETGMHWKAVPYTRSLVSLKALGEKDAQMVQPPKATATIRATEVDQRKQDDMS